MKSQKQFNFKERDFAKLPKIIKKILEDREIFEKDEIVAPPHSDYSETSYSESYSEWSEGSGGHTDSHTDYSETVHHDTGYCENSIGFSFNSKLSVSKIKPYFIEMINRIENDELKIEDLIQDSESISKKSLHLERKNRTLKKATIIIVLIALGLAISFIIQNLI